ncbi:hypothetical protein [Sutcliffiella halmapala]|uniref:hypothetical protein n=1 Tax=Sutcliffiella halmapala TaxID=79882 RepID=UPI000995A455|nr:hypothetical protein [Sutcliffiella halmapala]
MITKRLHIFIEYPIKDNVIQKYEQTMKHVLNIMKEIGAKEIKWTKTSYKKGITYYTESFFLPSESHYFALKKLRSSSRHQVFQELSECMDLKVGKIQYIGLKITS